MRSVVLQLREPLLGGQRAAAVRTVELQFALIGENLAVVVSTPNRGGTRQDIRDGLRQHTRVRVVRGVADGGADQRRLVARLQLTGLGLPVRTFLLGGTNLIFQTLLHVLGTTSDFFFDLARVGQLTVLHALSDSTQLDQLIGEGGGVLLAEDRLKRAHAILQGFHFLDQRDVLVAELVELVLRNQVDLDLVTIGLRVAAKGVRNGFKRIELKNRHICVFSRITSDPEAWRDDPLRGEMLMGETKPSGVLSLSG